jgi:hypothetical protein
MYPLSAHIQIDPDSLSFHITHPEKGVDFLVFRQYPRDESKCTETCPNIIRKEEYESEHSVVAEEAVTA